MPNSKNALKNKNANTQRINTFQSVQAEPAPVMINAEKIESSSKLLFDYVNRFMACIAVAIAGGAMARNSKNLVPIININFLPASFLIITGALLVFASALLFILNTHNFGIHILKSKFNGRSATEKLIFISHRIIYSLFIMFSMLIYIAEIAITIKGWAHS